MAQRGSLAGQAQDDRCVSGPEFEGPLVGGGRPGPVPIVEPSHPAKGRVGFREVGVQAESFLHLPTCFSASLVEGD